MQVYHGKSEIICRLHSPAPELRLKLNFPPGALQFSLGALVLLSKSLCCLHLLQEGQNSGLIHPGVSFTLGPVGFVSLCPA